MSGRVERGDVPGRGAAKRKATRQRTPEQAQKALEAAQKMAVATKRPAGYQTIKFLGLKARAGGKPARLTERVKEGLPFKSVEVLAEELGMSVPRFIDDYMLISRATASRRRKAGLLTTDESDKAVRFARLLEQATDLMECDEGAARRWLLSPLPLLGGESPLGYARTEVGAHEVEQLIGRLEHGVFS